MTTTMSSYVKLYVISLFLTVCLCSTPQCRNEKGEPVDWFYIYKLPREKNHLNPLVRQGSAYMYLTPSKLRGGWIVSDMAISDPRSMLGRTLAPLYQDRNILSVVYNDQVPTNENQPDVLLNIAEKYSKTKRGQINQQAVRKFKKFKVGEKYYDDYDLAEMCKMHSKFMKTRVDSGHTKGVLLGDKFTSLWLVHSVPRFPPVPNSHGLNVSSYDYPATGLKYGQTALCVSIQTSTLNQIGTQLKYNEPLIVYQHIPQELEGELPNLMDVIKNRTIDASPWYHIESFETLVGRKFLSFAKSAMFNDDLYSGLVAEVLQSDLLVESWTNGPGTLDSECNRNFQVRNIERLKFPIAKMSFTSHNDHSKWAVAVAHKMHNSQDTKVADYWVCVGDINRAELLSCCSNVHNFIWVFLVVRGCGGAAPIGLQVAGWDSINLHCRDNENRAVDWWYLYKPPARSFIERGRYFAYLTPHSEGRWESSNIYITASSMLLNTLSPMYRKTYDSHLAVAIYTERPGDKGSAVMGILLADEMGGVWISHTVPGLPDMTQDKPIFPEDEIENGHLLTCMTLDYAALDEIIRVLYLAQPAFTYVKVPTQLAELLPAWSLLNAPGQKFSGKAKVTEFLTREQKLKPLLIIRKPGDPRCLYKAFAKSRKVILDVYGDRDSDHKMATCTKDSGVRNINSLSLKFTTEVHYINNITDRAGFAVSTAAHWQRTGTGPTQYWTCTGSPEKLGGSGRGGMILCVEDYTIWVSFDKLKIKEPDC